MDRDSVSWRGYIPAITTPFNDDQELDVGMVRRLLEWLAQEQMHGIIIAGTTGEWFSMTTAEKQLLFKTVGEVLSGSMPLIAGCNAFTASEVVRHANTAAECGFDGILVTPPPYVRPCEAEVIAFYEEIDQQTPLPICIYNWPPGTNIDLSLATLTRLVELEHVVAIKNSTGNREHFFDVMRALNSKVRIFGAPMTEAGAQLILAGEADGTMGAGAVLGRAQPGFFEALWDKNLDQALAFASMDERIMREWFNQDYTARFGSAQAIFKAALNLQGLPGGMPRRPILPLISEGMDVVRSTLVELERL